MWLVTKNKIIFKQFYASVHYQNMKGGYIFAFQLEKCITIPEPRLISAFLCVRTFSLSGKDIQTCRKIVQTKTGNYANDMVYDFDANTDTWNPIKSVCLLRVCITSRLLLS